MARIPAEGTRPAVPPPAPPGLVIPAYFHPVARPGLWESLAGHAPQVRLVILNVASGPGDAPDPAFVPVVERLRAAGVAMAGYVDTNYGRRPRRQVLAEAGRYRDWYGVASVCFDRAAGTPGRLRHYAALADRSRANGAEVVFFNHGTHPHPGYAEHADLLGTFEGCWQAYLRLAVPHWTRSLPASKFYHVVYSVPPPFFGGAFLLSRRRHAGSMYITDNGGSNPYDRLPAGGFEPEAPWMRA
ncbi:MAG TPA: spherulation-specific family 4 protein [Streptosporangiaceae bacterium]|nr:spherulation-specific family 4 protein [Streptosporangiaceae bacterium]